MPKESASQKRKIERVMHEYKHGDLKSGPKGKAGKVKSRKQAVAIALSEAGASNKKRKSATKKRTSKKSATRKKTSKK